MKSHPRLAEEVVAVRWSSSGIRLLCVGLALVLASAAVQAQYRGRVYRSSPVVVSVGFHAPYYPYPFPWGFHGWWGFGWYPRVPYPYPYPYYGPYPQDISSLHIQVMPRETEVFVDGYFAGVVDDFDGLTQRLRLSPGNHVIELYLPGHRSTSQSMALQPGQTYRLRHTMEPLASGDPVPVRPSPPSTASPSSPASTARRVPRDPRRGSRDPASAPESATLAIRVQPADAIVLIDGQRWETSGGSILRVHVSPGSHRIEIQKPGFQTFTTTLNVAPGAEAPLNVSLSPVP